MSPQPVVLPGTLPLRHAHAASKPLAFLISLVGAGRVVYGTDFPFDMGGGPCADQLAGIELADCDREAIGGGNAASLFGPPGAAAPLGCRRLSSNTDL